MSRHHTLKLPYVVVDSNQDSKWGQVRATFKQHFLELQTERRATRDGFGWFGAVSVDGKALWRSPEAFGRETREMVEMELHLQLFHWALRRGYVTASGTLIA